MPKSNTEYWEEKFNKNQLRDKEAIEELRGKGYRVFVIWECQVGDITFLNTLANIIKESIRGSGQ